MESALEKALLELYKEEMIVFMKAHPEYFEEAIKLAVSNKERLAWRAAWLLWSCMEKNDVRIRKYIPEIIASMGSKSENHQRELFKILLQMKLTEEQEGLLYDKSVSIWEKISLTPSIRFTAFKFIVKTAEKYPELSNEIKLLTQSHYLEGLSPGLKKIIIKMIEEI